MTKPPTRVPTVAVLAVLAGVLAGCGGGGSSDATGGSGPPPPPTSYSVGGVVSGLSGTVVLQNNAGNDLTISVSGPFTFSAPLANGAAYAVTVLAQPTSATLTQTCTVSNSTGNIATANVATVTVECITTTINGLNVPPPPGSANDATLLGIDSDFNGIRDDLDIFIAAKYGGNANAVKGARISALASQNILRTDTAVRGAARLSLQESGDAGVCAGRAFRSAGLFSGPELTELYVRTYNTRERLQKHKAVGASAGQFERSVVGVVCP